MATLLKVILVGTGHLGGAILDTLARSPKVGRIVALSRDPERGRARCNLARLNATAAGRRVAVEHRSVDIAIPEQLAETVSDVAPDAIVHAASMQTWWLPDLFPRQPRRALRRAGFGVWLPLHLAPARSFVEGVSAAGYQGVVLNAAYPDVINVVLARAGLPVTAGVGNVDELVVKLSMRLADRLGDAPEAFDIQLVAHHALQRYAFTGGDAEAHGGHAGDASVDSDINRRTAPSVDAPPFHLRVCHRGRDITEESSAAEALLSPCPLPGGPAWGSFTAATTIRLLEALFAEAPSRLHAPGPEGLPGGYPVEVSAGSLRVPEIDGLTRAEAIGINERSHRFDGIDRIEDDGTVVFSAAAHEAIRDTIGYDCVALRPDDVEGRAEDLVARFDAYAARHGVDLTGC